MLHKVNDRKLEISLAETGESFKNKPEMKMCFVLGAKGLQR